MWEFIMHKLLLTAGVAAAAAIAMPASALVTVSYSTNATDISNYAASGPFTFDFNSGSEPAWNGQIKGPSPENGVSIPPQGSVGTWASAPGGNAIYTLTLGSDPVSSISFLWGSVDEYNTLTFVGTSDPGNSGNPYSFTGNGVFPGENNSQGILVTFTFTGTDQNVSALQFQSGSNAFEFDSVRVAAVPEPATWAMMIGGLALVGLTMRRRKANTAVQFA